jgi:hypothetical protein
MNIKKEFLLPAFALVAVGGTVLGVTQVFAQANTTGAYPPIVQALASKFNLDAGQVEAVFQQNRADNQAKAETRYEAFLAKAVTDGKISQAQSDLILAKHKELLANRQSQMATNKNLTPEQRKAAMQQSRTDLQNWAKANNVDISYLFGGMARGRFGRFWMRGK